MTELYGPMPRASGDWCHHLKPRKQGPYFALELLGVPAPWTPTFQTPDLQDYDTIHFWVFKPPSLPKKTKTRSRRTIAEYCNHPGKDEGGLGLLGRDWIPGIF